MCDGKHQALRKAPGALLPKHTTGSHSCAHKQKKHLHVQPPYAYIHEHGGRTAAHGTDAQSRTCLCAHTLVHAHTAICLSAQQQQQHCSPKATDPFTATNLCASVCVSYFQTVLCVFTTTSRLVCQRVCECIYLSEAPVYGDVSMNMLV